MLVPHLLSKFKVLQNNDAFLSSSFLDAPPRPLLHQGQEAQKGLRKKMCLLCQKYLNINKLTTLISKSVPTSPATILDFSCPDGPRPRKPSEAT